MVRSSLCRAARCCSRASLRALLDEFLKLDRDRALFNLKPRPKLPAPSSGPSGPNRLLSLRSLGFFLVFGVIFNSEGEACTCTYAFRLSEKVSFRLCVQNSHNHRVLWKATPEALSVPPRARVLGVDGPESAPGRVCGSWGGASLPVGTLTGDEARFTVALAVEGGGGEPATSVPF